MKPLTDDVQVEVETLPVKMTIRESGDYISMWYCPNEPDGEDTGVNSPQAIMIGSVRRQVCDRDRQVFEEWKRAMLAWFQRFAQSTTGGTVAIIQTHKPHDGLNRG